MGYIYIAWDQSKENMSKIGMTTQKPHSRISQTENPDYDLFKVYEIDDAELRYVEAKLHNIMARKFTRKKHKSTGRFSEWFICKPEKALEVVSDYLISKLSSELRLYAECANPHEGVKVIPSVLTSREHIEKQNELKEKIKVRLQSRKDGTYISPYQKGCTNALKFLEQGKADFADE